MTLQNRVPPRHSLRSLNAAIRAYYEETWIDYRAWWLNPGNRAIHFGFYDAKTRGHNDALLNTNRVLADRVGIQPGQRVLDAGCGVGGSAMWLAKQRGAEVIGLNLVHNHVERALRYAQERRLSGELTFSVADYIRGPFRDSSFDVVWALESVCHSPDKAAFYREAARLLRPGGRLVIAEYMRAARPLDNVGERLIHEWLDGWAIPDIDTSVEHVGYAASAGFVNTKLDDVTRLARPSLLRLYRLARSLYPLGVVMYRFGIRSRVQHGNLVGAVRQYQALKQGNWFYGILTATRP